MQCVKLSPNLRKLDKGVKQALLNKDTKVKVHFLFIKKKIIIIENSNLEGRRNGNFEVRKSFVSS